MTERPLQFHPLRRRQRRDKRGELALEHEHAEIAADGALTRTMVSGVLMASTVGGVTISVGAGAGGVGRAFVKAAAN